MSRIHEALQKAEQEKLAAAHVVEPDTEKLMPGLLGDPIPDAAAPALAASIDDVSPRAEAMPAAPLVSLLERCPQRVWTPEKEMLFLSKNSQHDIGMEEFRTLRSRLYHLREKRTLKTIVVGSALPAEGKSFVAANLAQVLARQHGRRVLLVDADLRKSKLHECVGAPAKPGLTEYLLGKADVTEVMGRGPMESLFFLPGGGAIANPAEVIANGKLKELFETVGPVFEWIIIDSPPVLPVSDATLIAAICDGVLLVVGAASTPFDLAQRARHEFRGSEILGVVLNRTSAESVPLLVGG